jgi:hypothetical protein
MPIVKGISKSQRKFLFWQLGNALAELNQPLLPSEKETPADFKELQPMLFQ